MAETGCQKNIRLFKEWREKLTDKELVGFIRGGNLHRTTVAKACGFSKSSWGSNKDLLDELEALEIELRGRGVLGKPKGKGEKGGAADTLNSKSKDITTGAIGVAEAAKLHQRILELESENEALKGNYGRFSEVAEVYRRLGQIKS